MFELVNGIVAIASSLLSMPSQALLAATFYRERETEENKPNKIFFQLLMLNLMDGVVTSVVGIQEVTDHSKNWFNLLCEIADILYVPSLSCFVLLLLCVQLRDLLTTEKKLDSYCYDICTVFLWTFYINSIVVVATLQANSLYGLDFFKFHRIYWAEYLFSALIFLLCAVAFVTTLFYVYCKRYDQTESMRHEYTIALKSVLVGTLLAMLLVKTAYFIDIQSKELWLALNIFRSAIPISVFVAVWFTNKKMATNAKKLLIVLFFRARHFLESICVEFLRGPEERGEDTVSPRTDA
ncbi:hypothetical protein QR680_009864 [Steinernema hermaphroditum]|uniref:Uncharacterized protein n=1 Tax=Steinernema hermaphroditum TaxID=289476 RepID=A0AA39M9N1_9BILA|nr:hypothetical protein QR680_009864 [Steinernema hermaphroditum]